MSLYVTNEITEEDVRSMREVFEALDSSGDGKVERSELKSAVLAIGINVDESSTGIQQLTGSALQDTAGSSLLDFDQFYKIISKHKAKAEKFTVDNIFKMFLQVDSAWDCKLAGDATKAKSEPRKAAKNPNEKWARKGCITWEDLKGLVEDLGEQVDDDVLKDMILTLDLDEDEVLGPDDFYNAINHASVLMAKAKTSTNPFSNLAPASAVGGMGGMQRSNTGLSQGGMSTGGMSSRGAASDAGASR